MAETGTVERLHQLLPSIRDAAGPVDPASSRAFMEFCEQLPAPGIGDDALATDCLYQAALAFDQSADYLSAATLYLQALTYPGIQPWIAANMHYRAAICMQMQGRTDPEISHHFQMAAQLGEQSPELRQLARYSLACLCLNTNDVAAAAEHFRFLDGETETVIPAIDLLSRYLRCTAQQGDPETADRILARLPPLPPLADWGLLQVFFDAATAAEKNRLYVLAAEIYQRILACGGLLPSLRANAHFRLGVVLEYEARWLESMDHYKTAIGNAEADREIADLSRFHLSLLLMAAEEYAEAATHLYEITQSASLGSRPDVHVRHAVCLIQCGEHDAAERVLLTLEDAPLALKARIDQLLAEIHEGRKDYRSAATCYARIAQNPSAEIATKCAAIQRLSTINPS